MKTVILGGGITGLTASYLLRKKGNETVIIEKEAVLGGLASGFREKEWGWPLERSYHHIFSNDSDILGFSEEIEYDRFSFSEPRTTSLYRDGNNYRTFTVDTPQDFLTFPLLSIPEKLRAGMVIAFLKASPHLSFYEKKTAAAFLRQTMGDRVWKVLWEELFRKKFGKNAENILASFIWARIKKRTKKLGYPEGGFQDFIDALEQKNRRMGAAISKGRGAAGLIKKGRGFVTVLETGEKIESDNVISTLPTPILLRLGKDILPPAYLRSLGGIRYSHAVGFVIETDEPYFKDEYWVSVCDKAAPMMVLVQHTNLVSRQHYNNRHILYIGNYVDADDPIYMASPDRLIKIHTNYLDVVLGRKIKIMKRHYFKTPFAQPLFDRDFLKHMPRFETPLKGFFLANLDMTYPYDRGTNYAVKLGKEVAGML